MAPPQDDGNGNKPTFPNCGDSIDAGTFEQILEMDDDDQREFSRELVFGFFDQSTQTFDSMEKSLKDKNLHSLSELGHYLKGSSATLGLTRVRDHCEKIQHLGAEKNEQGEGVDWDEEEFLKKIRDILPQLKNDCADVERRLRRFYEYFPPTS